MSKNYNIEGVTTVTPKNDQYIFMDSDFNAKFDVNVLASAFNMDKADFMGRLKLIDDFTSFDNERFSEIMAASDMIEPITPQELALMSKVHAIIVDREWFQIYDNNNKFTEDYVAAGMYWNYFYNVWKTVSYSPFSNIVAFTTPAFDEEPIVENVRTDLTGIEEYDGGKIFTVKARDQFSPYELKYEQTEALTKAGVAVHPYGAYIVPDGALTDTLPISASCVFRGKTYQYTGTISLTTLPEVGSTFSLNLVK